MSSEYDFLDDFFSEDSSKNRVPCLSFTESSQSVDSFNEANVKSDQVENLKKQNLKLRSRVKWYCKALDQHKVRLTQLLTEKLTLREEQRKHVDCEKKLEEASLYVQATEQLNKQLQELSKSHDKEKNEWKEKFTTLQDKIKDLKKSVADLKQKKESVKKKRKKYLQALLELSNILIHSDLFPKKYKRLHLSWKNQLENIQDDDCSFDLEEDISESPEKSSLSYSILLPQSTPKKSANGCQAAATLAVMSESEMSEEEGAASHSPAKFVVSPKKVQHNTSKNSSVSSANDRLIPLENDVITDISEKVMTIAVSTPRTTGSSIDQSATENVIKSVESEILTNRSAMSPCVSSEQVEVVVNVEVLNSSLEEDEWGLCGDGCSRDHSLSEVLETKGMKLEKNLLALGDTEMESEMLETKGMELEKNLLALEGARKKAEMLETKEMEVEKNLSALQDTEKEAEVLETKEMELENKLSALEGAKKKAEMLETNGMELEKNLLAMEGSKKKAEMLETNQIELEKNLSALEDTEKEAEVLETKEMELENNLSALEDTEMEAEVLDTNGMELEKNLSALEGSKKKAEMLETNGMELEKNLSALEDTEKKAEVLETKEMELENNLSALEDTEMEAEVLETNGLELEKKLSALEGSKMKVEMLETNGIVLENNLSALEDTEMEAEVLETNGMELEKNLLALEDTEMKRKEDEPCLLDKSSLLLILDEMVVKLDLLMPFDDVRSPANEPEKEFTCHQIIRSSPVKGSDFSLVVKTRGSSDDWGVVPPEEETVVKVCSGREQLPQKKLPEAPKPGNSGSETVTDIASVYPKCNNELEMRIESGKSDFLSIWTSGRCDEKSDKSNRTDSLSVVHHSQEKEEAIELPVLQSKTNANCDNNFESNLDINSGCSDLDLIPDSGFNSPESPVAEIGEQNVLFEKPYYSNACEMKISRDFVSIGDSGVSLKADTLKHTNSSVMSTALFGVCDTRVSKVLPEASCHENGPPKKKGNTIEEKKSPLTQKEKKSLKKKSPSKQQECSIQCKNDGSISKIRRSKRLMELEESVPSIKTRSKLHIREVSSSPKSKDAKNNRMNDSGTYKNKKQKERTSDEETDDSLVSLKSLENDDFNAISTETEVLTLDTISEKTSKSSVPQNERVSGRIHLQSKESRSSDVETDHCSNVSSPGEIEVVQNDVCDANSEVIQQSENINLNSQEDENNCANSSSPCSEGDRISVSDLAKKSDMLSDTSFGDIISFTSDGMMSCHSEEDNIFSHETLKVQNNNKVNNSREDENKSTNSRRNDQLDFRLGVMNDKISAKEAGPNHSQALSCIEKGVNSGKLEEICTSWKRNDVLVKDLTTRKQPVDQVEEGKLFGASCMSMPSFNELIIKSSTPNSKFTKHQRDYCKAFYGAWNSEMHVKNSKRSDMLLTEKEINSNSTSSGSLELNRNSTYCVDKKICEEEISELKNILKETRETMNYPLSAKHLSFLRKPYSSPLEHFIEEQLKPRSSILVRCNYKNSNKRISETGANDSSLTVEDQSMLLASLSLHESNEKRSPCLFAYKLSNQKSQLKNEEESPNKTNKSPIVEKCKPEGIILKRPVVPFFFGKCNLHYIYKVKFWICGYFASESFVEAYSSSKCSVVGFGHGDLKEFIPSDIGNSCLKSLPPKFCGVKYHRKGSLGSFMYTDQYLLPVKPLLNLFHVKPKFSALLDGNDSVSPKIHGRKTCKTPVDTCTGSNLSVREDKISIRSGVLNDSGNMLKKKSNINFVETVQCAKPRVENFSFESCSVGKTKVKSGIEVSERTNEAGSADFSATDTAKTVVERECQKSDTFLQSSNPEKMNILRQSNSSRNISPTYSEKGASFEGSLVNRNIKDWFQSSGITKHSLPQVIHRKSKVTPVNALKCNISNESGSKSSNKEKESGFYSCIHNSNSSKNVTSVDSSIISSSAQNSSHVISSKQNFENEEGNQLSNSDCVDKCQLNDQSPSKLPESCATDVADSETLLNEMENDSSGSNVDLAVTGHGTINAINHGMEASTNSLKRKLRNTSESNEEPWERLKVIKKAKEVMTKLGDDSEDITCQQNKTCNGVSSDLQRSSAETENLGHKKVDGYYILKTIPNANDHCKGLVDEGDELVFESDLENDDGFIIDTGPQEMEQNLIEDNKLKETKSSSAAGALLDGDSEECVNDIYSTLSIKTKCISTKQAFNMGRNETEMRFIHPAEVELEKHTQKMCGEEKIKDSQVSRCSERLAGDLSEATVQFYENPPKKRRIAYLPNADLVGNNSGSIALDESHIPRKQHISENSISNVIDSNSVSGFFVDEGILILGESGQFINEVQNVPVKTSRKPRKQCFYKLREGANLHYSPPPEVVAKMLFGDIEESEEEVEANDSTTFKDPQNLLGDLNESIDTLYEKSKKIRIAHAPKTKTVTDKSVCSYPKESDAPDSSVISKPVAKKSSLIMSTNSFNQKTKVKQSKLEKLRIQISKARGMCSRTVVDKNVISSNNVQDGHHKEEKVTAFKDATDVKCDKITKEEEVTTKKASNNVKADQLVEEKVTANDVKCDKPTKNDRVTTSKVSNIVRNDQPTKDKTVTMIKASNPMKGRKKKDEVSFDEKSENVTSEEELDLQSKKALLTRKRSPIKSSERKSRKNIPKKSSKTMNDLKHLFSSESDGNSSVEEQEVISPERGDRKKKKTVDENNGITSLELPNSPQMPDSKLVKESNNKVSSISNKLSEIVDSGSVEENVARKTSILLDCNPKVNSGLEKENCIQESLSTLLASSPKISHSSLLKEEGKKESSKESSDCADSSVTEENESNCKRKNDMHSEFLENLDVPPLSPLSSDELVDSLILCSDINSENWSPMKPSKKKSEGNVDLCKSVNEEKSSEPLPSEESASNVEKVLDNPAEPMKDKSQEGIKDFFYNLIQEHKGRGYQNKNDIEEGDKEALKNLLGGLKRKIFRNEDLDLLVIALNDEVRNFKSKSLAKYLVGILMKEDEDDVDHPAVPTAPRLSDMQLRVLSLTLALDARCPRFSNLIDVILKGMQYKLFRLGHSPQVEVMMSLARMFAVFCKVRKDLQMARTFCYDALFSLGLKAYAVIFIMLSIWPEVFRKQNNGRVVELIENSILIAIMEQKVAKRKGEGKVVPVQNILRNTYKSEHHLVKSSDLVKKLILELKEGKKSEGIEATTILLCKKQGWEWTHGHLLCQNLVSILDDWEKGKVSVASAVAAVKLIGFISRSCSLETAGPVKAIVDMLYEGLGNQDIYPMEIQEALAISLIRLSRYQLQRVAHALDNWAPTSLPSEELVSQIIKLIHRTPNRYWGRHFRQWLRRPRMPKGALVPFSEGTYFTEVDVSKMWESEGIGGEEMEGENGGEEEEEEEEEGEQKGGVRVRGGSGGQRGSGVRCRGGRRGNKRRRGQRNARWVHMQHELGWIKEEEKKWDEIAWVKRVGTPRAEKHDAEKLMSYEGNVFE